MKGFHQAYKGNKANQYGGAVGAFESCNFDDNSRVTLNFSDNEAKYGGAVFTNRYVAIYIQQFHFIEMYFHQVLLHYC